jgi:hypothetical protein
METPATQKSQAELNELCVLIKKVHGLPPHDFAPAKATATPFYRRICEVNSTAEAHHLIEEDRHGALSLFAGLIRETAARHDGLVLHVQELPSSVPDRSGSPALYTDLVPFLRETCERLP